MCLQRVSWWQQFVTYIVYDDTRDWCEYNILCKWILQDSRAPTSRLTAQSCVWSHALSEIQNLSFCLRFGAQAKQFQMYSVGQFLSTAHCATCMGLAFFVESTINCDVLFARRGDVWSLCTSLPDHTTAANMFHISCKSTLVNCFEYDIIWWACTVL